MLGRCGLLLYFSLHWTLHHLVVAQGAAADADGLKTAIAALDVKVEGVKEKLQSLNALEYAFKMTNFDNSLKSIVTNVELMTKKLTDMETKVADLVAGKIQITARSSQEQAPPAPAQQAPAQQPADPAFQKKMEEYGEKMLSVQHSLVTEVKGHAEVSGGVKTLLENGLNKIFVKLDSLLGLQATGTSFQQVVENVADIKHTILATTVGSNSTTERINELYNTLKSDWTVMEKELMAMKAILKDVSRLNNVTEMVQGARIEEVQAVVAKLRQDITQISAAEEEFKQATNAGSQLTKMVGNLGNQEVIALTANLTAALSNFQQGAIPLIGAVDSGFQLMLDILDKNVTIGSSKTMPFVCGGLRFLSMDVTKMERVLSERLQTIQNSVQCGGGTAGMQKIVQDIEQVAKNLKPAVCPSSK